MDLSGSDLTQMGTAMFGTQWKRKLAEQLDLSEQRIYQLSRAATISSRVRTKVCSLYEQWQQSGGGIEVQTIAPQSDPDANMTDQEILDRINKRFGVMNKMVDGMLKGVIRSMIVFGAPGIGKTYDIERALSKAEKDSDLYYNMIKGTCSAPGLYQSLYYARDGGVVVLDDCDSIFNDEQAFNILKSALDSTGTRTIAWRKQSNWVYDIERDGENDADDRVPNKFEFNGGVIFITNIDFTEKSERDLKSSPHFKALLSRSMYLDLTLKTNRARIIRIRDVFLNSMRADEKLTIDQASEILVYVLENAERMRELSLRSMKLICQLYHLGSDWKEVVEYTMMKHPSFQ